MCQVKDIGRNIKILVLEDRWEDYLLLKETLQSATEFKAELVLASRLQQAIEVAYNQSADVAVIDLNLPDSSGLQTFLTFHEAHPHLPVVILTGQQDNDAAFEAVCKGAQDYLNKGEPSSTAVIRTIRYAIERQRLMEELRSTQEQVKHLHGLLPICAACKNIRDDRGYWRQIESYISEHSQAQFSHGLCPACAEKLYPEHFRSKR